MNWVSPMVLLLGVAAAAPTLAKPRTILTAVEEYLHAVRSGGTPAYTPVSMRVKRSEAAEAEAIDAGRLRELLASCVTGNRSAGFLPPDRRRVRIRQEWRCETAGTPYPGLVATFITDDKAKRVDDVEIVLRDTAFSPPSPPPPMRAVPPRGRQ